MKKILYRFYTIAKSMLAKDVQINLKIRFILDKFFIKLFFLQSFFRKIPIKLFEKKKHNTKLKIGVLGAFSGLLSFPKELFEKYPKNSIELYLYDEGYKDIYMNSYRDFSKYNQIPSFNNLFEYSYYETIINMVSEDSLDYLIIINRDKTYYLVLSQILSKVLNLKLISLNTGGHVLFVDNVQIQSAVQLNNSYKIKNNKMFCKDSLVFEKINFYEDLFHFDITDLKKGQIPVVKKIIEKRIVFSGSFYKLAHPIFLNVCREILKKDKQYKFYFYGKGDKRFLDEITVFFKNNNISEQVFYMGSYSKLKGEDGNYIDNSWENAKNIIGNASVFLNSFPISGASSTMEAFALDVPVLTMISNKKNLTSYYLPSITPVTAICKSTQEYIDKAIQLLDGNLALKKRILTEQQSILKNMTSEEKFWERLLFAIKETYES